MQYEEAVAKIREYVAERNMAPGERLPSERGFERLIGVTRATASKAVARLIADGVLRRDGYKLYLADDQPAAAGLSRVHVIYPRGPRLYRLGPLEAAHDVAREHAGYAIPVLTATLAEEREAFERLLSEPINGFVLWPHGPDCHVDLLDRFQRQGTPFVICDQDVNDYDFVGIDNERGTELAVRHLVEQGHRNLVYLTISQAFPSAAHRFAGYRQACLTAGLRESADRIIEVPDFSEAQCAGAFATMRDHHPHATAFVAGNDMLALGVLAAARSAGLRVPDDLSAVGFDDIDAAALAVPALTTIRQDFYEIGYLATQLLFERLTHTPPRDSKESVRIRLQPRLIVRQSVARFAGNKREVTQ